jgi:hypothetical protein
MDHTCSLCPLCFAGCRVTSIQRFLGHKKLSSTMIYAKAHDQTVADDYFAAMERVEQRLALDDGIIQQEDEVVKVQEQILVFAEQLAQPKISFSERLSIAEQLRVLFGAKQEHALPKGKSYLFNSTNRLNPLSCQQFLWYRFAFDDTNDI